MSHTYIYILCPPSTLLASIKMITNWKDKLLEALGTEPLLAVNIGNKLYQEYELPAAFALLSREFDDDYGTSLGTPFFAWSSQSVFFTLVAEGHEWIGKVPRHPSSGFPVHLGEE